MCASVTSYLFLEQVEK